MPTLVRVRGKKGNKRKRQDERSPARCSSLADGGIAIDRVLLQANGNEPRLSLLESLPTELLQHVFLLSLNFELPTVSPVLYRTLTSDWTKTTLLKALFVSSSSSSSSSTHFSPSSSFGHTVPETTLAEAQSALLRTKWLTYELLDKHGLIPTFHLAKGAQIPAKVLRGPWPTTASDTPNNDRLALLNLLTYHHASRELEREGDEEAVRAGLLEAISARSPAIYTLTGRWALLNRLNRSPFVIDGNTTQRSFRPQHFPYTRQMMRECAGRPLNRAAHPGRGQFRGVAMPDSAHLLAALDVAEQDLLNVGPDASTNAQAGEGGAEALDGPDLFPALDLLLPIALCHDVDVAPCQRRIVEMKLSERPEIRKLGGAIWAEYFALP